MKVPEQSVSGAVAAIEEAVVLIVAEASSARVQERFVAQSGVGLERSAYVVLRGVSDRGSVRLTELAGDLGLDVSTVSRHVKGLEGQGLVVRRDDPRDRRVACVELSATGVETLERLRNVRHQFFAEVFEAWPPEDRDRLARLLGRLAHDLLAVGGRL